MKKATYMASFLSATAYSEPSLEYISPHSTALQRDVWNFEVIL